MVERGQLAGRGGRLREGRRLTSPIKPVRRWLGLALLALAALLGTPGVAAAKPLSISVNGNSFVNGAGQTVRLLGVDRPGTEYACEQGWGYSSGPIDAADAAAIKAWNVNAVRIPLNEDCWLRLNGQPSGGLSAVTYHQTVQAYVKALAKDGIYSILDLHWSAPGKVVADGQRSMPDPHSTAFWTSVASTFKHSPWVLFDAFNEPYSPAYDGYSAYPVSWSCWRNGGCTVPDARDGTTPVAGQTYAAVGMQQLVNAIRATGATNPILVGGLAYANDLTGWLANEPNDPDHQLAASVHVYNGNDCSSVSCWNSQLAPVAAQVPLVTGEFDESDCSENFDDSYMNWADAHGVSYLAWGWYVLTGQPCSSLYLVTDSSGTPASPNGVAVHSHLESLPALH
jgi:endoglucanase